MLPAYKKKLVVAVLLDAYSVSGSAKVVIQNLRALPPDISAFAVLFRRKGAKPSELEVELQRLNIDFELISESFAFDPRVIIRVIRTLTARSTQVIESNHYKTHLLSLISSKLLRLPWIAVSHGWTAENTRIRFYNFLDRLSLPWATGCIAMGPTIVTHLLRILPKSKRPRCWPTAFDLLAPRESLPERDLRTELAIAKNEFLFAAIGRLSFEKGFDVLIDAVKLLVDFGLSFRVILLGSGPEEKRLQDQIKDLGLQKYLLFLGQKASSELPLYYQVVDSLVISSRSEGLPNVLLEAAWFKCPVVATKVGGIPQMMDGVLAKWLCDPNDAKQLAALMREMMGLPTEERKSLTRELGARLQKNYLAENRTKKVYRLYRAAWKIHGGSRLRDRQ